MLDLADRRRYWRDAEVEVGSIGFVLELGLGTCATGPLKGRRGWGRLAHRRRQIITGAS